QAWNAFSGAGLPSSEPLNETALFERIRHSVAPGILNKVPCRRRSEPEPDKRAGGQHRGPSDSGPAMNSHGFTRVQLPGYAVHEEIEFLHIFGNSSIVDGKVEILDPAGPTAFCFQNQSQFLHFTLREHGDKDFNSGTPIA